MTDEQERRLLAYHGRNVTELSDNELRDYSTLLEMLILDLEEEALER